jgi:hypothetical protein
LGIFSIRKINSEGWKVKSAVKYCILVIAIIGFSACSQKSRIKPPKPKTTEQQKQQPPQQSAKWVNGTPRMWTDSKPKRDSYNVSKPEPYSIESGQQDPEVLGPQGKIEIEKDIAPVASNEKSEFIERG